MSRKYRLARQYRRSAHKNAKLVYYRILQPGSNRTLEWAMRTKIGKCLRKTLKMKVSESSQTYNLKIMISTYLQYSSMKFHHIEKLLVIFKQRWIYFHLLTIKYSNKLLIEGYNVTCLVQHVTYHFRVPNNFQR